MTTADLTLRYRHNTEPHRGLAATGAVLIKLLLVVPHSIVVGALQNLTIVLAYIGYWIVGISGEMPQAVHRMAEISFGWTARMWGWLTGIVDIYPPFETDPEYPIGFATPPPESPSRALAWAGAAFIKLLMAVPHIVVMAFLGLGAMVAMWFGYLVVLLTGQFPTGLQDFLAGVLQWSLRVSAWLVGITDDYPPFELAAAPGR
jgi:hypothetical protein